MTSISHKNNTEEKLVSYNNAWISRANAEISTLRVIFPQPFFYVEHVGGTAVAESRTRSIIDLLIVYDSNKVSKQKLSEKLAEVGFCFNETLQIFQSEDSVIALATACLSESVEAAETVMFRDLLRSTPELLKSYNEKKAQWVEKYGINSLEYREEKSRFQNNAIKSIGREGETFAQYIEELESDRSVGIVPVCFVDGTHEKGEQELRVCLVRAQKGFWSFPKGHPENKEKDVETAIRELREETGIENARVLTDHFYVDEFTFQAGSRSVKKTVQYYLAIVPCEEHQIAKEWEHEISEYRWVSLDEAIVLANFPTTRKIVDWLKNVRKTWNIK